MQREYLVMKTNTLTPDLLHRINAYWRAANRALGPPLNEGEHYTLAIDSGMLDMSGRPLRTSFRKTFHVLGPAGDAIAVEQWKIRLPRPAPRESLDLKFPRPMDSVSLWHTVSVASEDGQPIEGRISMDQSERRWSFTPSALWRSGSYCFCIESSLEDVCSCPASGDAKRPDGRGPFLSPNLCVGRFCKRTPPLPEYTGERTCSTVHSEERASKSVPIVWAR